MQTFSFFFFLSAVPRSLGVSVSVTIEGTSAIYKLPIAPLITGSHPVDNKGWEHAALFTEQQIQCAKSFWWTVSPETVNPLSVHFQTPIFHNHLNCRTHQSCRIMIYSTVIKWPFNIFIFLNCYYYYVCVSGLHRFPLWLIPTVWTCQPVSSSSWTGPCLSHWPSFRGWRRLHVSAPHSLCVVDVNYYHVYAIFTIWTLLLCFCRWSLWNFLFFFTTAIPVFESPPTLSPLYQLIVQCELRLQDDGNVTPPCPHNMTFYSVSVLDVLLIKYSLWMARNGDTFLHIDGYIF